MFDYVIPAPDPQPPLYKLHCSRGTLIDAFPGWFRSRDEALGAASNLLKCANWSDDSGFAWTSQAGTRLALTISAKCSDSCALRPKRKRLVQERG